MKYRVFLKSVQIWIQNNISEMYIPSVCMCVCGGGIVCVAVFGDTGMGESAVNNV